MSKKGNEIKNAALGMSHGTAANRLRKMILFSLVCELKRNVCYQCNKEIISVGDLSIEHKEPWLQADNPVTSFFDLDNIAFSHLSCNIAAARHPPWKYSTEGKREVGTAKRKRKNYYAIPIKERQCRRRKQYKRYGS